MDAINEILIYNTGLSASASKLMSADSDNKPVLRVPVGEECEHEHEVMKSNFIKLSWKDVKAYTLPVGSRIKYGGADWVLFDAYMPTANNDGYTYEPQFQHPEMVLGRTPLLLSTNLSDGTATKQTDWTITDTPSNIIAAIIKIIKAETNVTLTASYIQGDALKASGTCDFSATDILSALNTWASEFDAEWHIDWSSKKLYFGTVVSIAGTTTPSLVVGQNIGVPAITDNTPEYRNYFIVRGSSKNISQTTASGENIQSDARLTLNLTDYPNSAIDKRKANEPKLVDILQFDDIYPHLDLYVYAPIELKKYRYDDNKQKIIAGYDNDNNPIYEVYSMWFVKLAYPTVSNGVTTWHAFTINPTTDLISGTTLTASFKANENGTSSKLAGREFEMAYLTTSTIYDSIDSPSVTIPSGYFYIKFVEENDIIIPMTSALGSLVPYGEGESLDDLNANNGADGYGNDMLTLYNLVMTGDYLTSAQSELKNAADKEIAKRATNANNYSFDANACAGTLNLAVGQAVNYTDNGKTLATRVIKIVQKLDIPAQMNITVGNSIVKGNTQTLQEDVKSANGNISILQAVNENAAIQLQATNRALKAIQEFSEMWKLDSNGCVYSERDVYSMKGMSALGYNSGSGGSSSGGIDMISVWSALLDATNEQINISHLTTALSNYYNKTDVNGLISQIPKFATKVVSSLPTSDISSTTIYLLTDSEAKTGNLYKEYIYINNKWELLGTQKADISNLIPKVEGSTDILLASGSSVSKSTLLNGYATQSWVEGKNYLTEHQSLADYLKTTDISTWAKASVKPTYTASEVGALPSTTAIPTKTSDLTNDSGYLTEHQSLSNYVDKTSEQTISGIKTLKEIRMSYGGMSPSTWDGKVGRWVSANNNPYGCISMQLGNYGGYTEITGFYLFNNAWDKILFSVLNNGNATIQGTISEGGTLLSEKYLSINSTAVASTKLANSRTLWGQSFDGTADVSGAMSGVTRLSVEKPYTNNEEGAAIDLITTTQWGTWRGMVATDYFGGSIVKANDDYMRGMFFVGGRYGHDNFIFTDNRKNPLFKIGCDKSVTMSGKLSGVTDLSMNGVLSGARGEIKGVHQLIPNGDWQGLWFAPTISTSNGVTTIENGLGTSVNSGVYLTPSSQPVASHKHLVVLQVELEVASDIRVRLDDVNNGYTQLYFYVGSTDKTTLTNIYTATSVELARYRICANGLNGKVVKIYKFMMIDLTTMFGANNEPTSADEFARRLGYASIDDVPYIPYSESGVTLNDAMAIGSDLMVGGNKMVLGNGLVLNYDATTKTAYLTDASGDKINLVVSGGVTALGDNNN